MGVAVGISFTLALAIHGSKLVYLPYSLLCRAKFKRQTKGRRLPLHITAPHSGSGSNYHVGGSGVFVQCII